MFHLVLINFEWHYSYCGKVKHELRVTSSNLRVRRLKAQVARLKAHIRRLKARVEAIKQ